MRPRLLLSLVLLVVGSACSGPRDTGPAAPIAATSDPGRLFAECDQSLAADLVGSMAGEETVAVVGGEKWHIAVNRVPELPIDTLGDVAVEGLLADVEERAPGYEWGIWDDSGDRLVLVGEQRRGTAYRVASFTPDGAGAWDLRRVKRVRCRLMPRDADGGLGLYRSWQLDPSSQPDPESSELAIWLSGGWCDPPHWEDVVPHVLSDDDSVMISILAPPPERVSGCDRGKFYPLQIDIGEPLGERRILKGSLVPANALTWPPRRTSREAPLPKTVERSLWSASFEDRLRTEGLEYMFYRNGSKREEFEYVLYLDDPDAVEIGPTLAGSTIDVRPVPEGTHLRNGRLWLDVPADVPKCAPGLLGLCRADSGEVSYRTEQGCTNAPTTIPPGAVDYLICGL